MVWVTFQRLNVLEPFQKPRKFIHWALPIFLACRKAMPLVLRDPNFINDCKNPSNERLCGFSEALKVHFGSHRLVSCTLPGCSDSSFSSLTLLISEAQYFSTMSVAVLSSPALCPLGAPEHLAKFGGLVAVMKHCDQKGEERVNFCSHFQATIHH